MIFRFFIASVAFHTCLYSTPGDGIQPVLVNVRKIHSFREVLPEQAIGVFIGATLPGTLWITEVNRDVRVQTEPFVIGHLFAAIPG